MSADNRVTGAGSRRRGDVVGSIRNRGASLWGLARRRPLLAGMSLLGLAACASAGVAVAGGLGDLPLASAPAAPTTFGFGTAASAARIAQWDINAFPDGKGLPTGSGTVAEGAQVFARACAGCHGANADGGSAGTLVGTAPWTDQPGTTAIGGYWPYATTIYDYVRRAMPQNAPGTLTANETYAVTAFILNKNQLLAENGRLDGPTLAAIRMPARDRFVPDDRTGGRVIR
jgi:S-disulfanyl-L-cysteine oxidoreductase SoxD